MKVAVIGAGASGLIAAGFASKNGHKVDLFEANEKIGKKIYITGKGRCNVTNYSAPENILNNVINNSKFLYSSLYSFTSFDVVDFFEGLGVPIKIERGDRAFPASDKSSDIIKALERFNIKNGTNILLNHKVIDINVKNVKFTINTTSGVYNNYDATIICVGGCSYSATGSKGDGYIFAKKMGHKVSKLYPALVPIVLSDEYVKSIEGVSLKNVKLKCFVNDKPHKELFGEMIFTSNGISGPIALSMSSYINKLSNVSLSIDFKPALSEETLLNRVLRDIETMRESQVGTLMGGLLPKSLIPIFLNKTNILQNRKNKTLNSKEIELIVDTLKNFKLEYLGLADIDFGIITCGGVDVKEINPKTMESKLIPNLYFAGELLDVDALTGGYNLQIAFSTGYTAGNSVGGSN